MKIFVSIQNHQLQYILKTSWIKLGNKFLKENNR